jgi:MFS family permease
MAVDRPAQVRDVLRHRNFLLLWSGQAISIAGNGIFTVALPLEVLHLSSSPLALALVISGRMIPSLVLLLIGGTLVDRFPRRPVMLISDAGCGISVLILTFLIVTGKERVWELFVLAVTLGIASAFFRPASTAIVRDILPRELLVPANSLSSLSQSAAQYLLGPLAGGIIVAVIGASWAFGIDAASFAVGAACLAAMRDIKEVRAARSRLLAGIMEGVRYCRSQCWLWWSMVGIGAANLVYFVPFTILQPLLVRNVFHAGPVALGIMYAASGGGGALASIFATRRKPPLRRVGAIWTAWSAAGLCASLIALCPWLWLAVVFAGMTWGLATYGNIIWLSMIQQETPPKLLGRVSSIDWLFSLALSPLGAMTCGVAVLAVGVRVTLLAGGLITAAAGGVLLIPGMTDPDKRMIELRASGQLSQQET